MSVIQDALRRADVAKQGSSISPNATSGQRVINRAEAKLTANLLAEPVIQKTSKQVDHSDRSWREWLALAVVILAILAVLVTTGLSKPFIQDTDGATFPASMNQTQSIPSQALIGENALPSTTSHVANSPTVDPGEVEPIDIGPVNNGLLNGRNSGRPPESMAAVNSYTARRYDLSGVVMGPSGRRAVINNSMVAVGDEIDGATVIQITATTARLNADARQIDLHLKPTANQPSGYKPAAHSPEN